METQRPFQVEVTSDSENTHFSYIWSSTYYRCMSSEEHEVYVMQGEEGDEWVSPTPVRVVIREELTSETDLDEDDLEALEEYVDLEELEDVLHGDTDGSLAFTVEDHDLTVYANGDVKIDE